MLERLRFKYAPLYFVSDLTLTCLALFLAGAMRPHISLGTHLSAEQTRVEPYVYLWVVVIWSLTFLLLSVYKPRNHPSVGETQAAFLAVTVSTLVLAAVLYFSSARFSRVQFVTFYVLDILFLVGYRLLVHLSQKLLGVPKTRKRSVLILGAGPDGCDAMHMIERHGWTGLEPVGFLDDAIPLGTEVEGFPVLGRLEEVEDYVKSRGVDEVVVALPIKAYDRFFGLLDNLQRLPVRVRIVPDHIKTTLIRTRVEEFAGVPMITLQKPTLTPFERKVKRAFDLAIGPATLLLTAPVLILIGIAIWIDSPGPVLYRQRRVGERGKLFWMYKFRSMVKDAEKQQQAVLRESEGGIVFEKLPNDPRVTRVGKIIRRTSLDELPQLFNVIKGEMSLVGPRPELPFLVEGTYSPWQWQRFSVPQGITGWWQINGRSDKPMHLHTEEDLHYIQHYSLLLDVLILWRTIGAVVKRQGAY
jgi:exopolysaccharide biosynthesis polyprenyl glycosylphosphotransferase